MENELYKKLKELIKSGKNEEAEELKKELKEKIRKEKHECMIEAWNSMSPFKDADSIPPIPLVDAEEYGKYIIPNIIRCGGIRKKELKDGHTYEGSCRNASKAVWNDEGQYFTYQRTKFGYTFTERINHFEDDDGYDIFVPLKDLGDVNVKDIT